MPMSNQPVKPGDPTANSQTSTGVTGHVVHDDRGNAVWDWMKQTGRAALDTTTRMLRRLETPELKMEDTLDKELRIEPDPASGGGYDPYNQRTKPRQPPRR